MACTSYHRESRLLGVSFQADSGEIAETMRKCPGVKLSISEGSDDTGVRGLFEIASIRVERVMNSSETKIWSP